jgi:hypothetical protein
MDASGRDDEALFICVYPYGGMTLKDKIAMVSWF